MFGLIPNTQRILKHKKERKGEEKKARFIVSISYACARAPDGPTPPPRAVDVPFASLPFVSLPSRRLEPGGARAWREDMLKKGAPAQARHAPPLVSHGQWHGLPCHEVHGVVLPALQPSPLPSFERDYACASILLLNETMPVPQSCLCLPSFQRDYACASILLFDETMPVPPFFSTRLCLCLPSFERDCAYASLLFDETLPVPSFF